GDAHGLQEPVTLGRPRRVPPLDGGDPRRASVLEADDEGEAAAAGDVDPARVVLGRERADPAAVEERRRPRDVPVEGGVGDVAARVELEVGTGVTTSATAWRCRGPSRARGRRRPGPTRRGTPRSGRPPAAAPAARSGHAPARGTRTPARTSPCRARRLAPRPRSRRRGTSRP